MVDQIEIRTLGDLDAALKKGKLGAHLEGSKLVLADGSGIGHLALKSWTNMFAFLGLALFQFTFGLNNWYGRLLIHLLLIGAAAAAILSIRVSCFHFSVRKRLRELAEQEASDE